MKIGGKWPNRNPVTAYIIAIISPKGILKDSFSYSEMVTSILNNVIVLLKILFYV